MLFLHRHHIRPDSSPKSPGGAIPQEYEITAVRSGTVYFGRPGSGHGSWKTSLEGFEASTVLKWIEPQAEAG
jgi:hypothetical protein